MGSSDRDLQDGRRTEEIGRSEGQGNCASSARRFAIYCGRLGTACPAPALPDGTRCPNLRKRVPVSSRSAVRALLGKTSFVRVATMLSAEAGNGAKLRCPQEGCAA